jgi:hypothetical protein
MKRTDGQTVIAALLLERVPEIPGIPGHGTLELSDALQSYDSLRVLHFSLAARISARETREGRPDEVT